MVRTHGGSRSETASDLKIHTVRTLIVHNELLLIICCRTLYISGCSHEGDSVRYVRLRYRTCRFPLSADEDRFNGYAELAIYFAEVAVHCIQQTIEAGEVGDEELGC